MAKTQVTTIDDDNAPDTAASAKTQAAAVVGANADEALSGERRTVTIHTTDTDGGSDAVFVGLNGYAYQIPRGIPVEVPVEVLEILNSAKQSIFTSVPGGAVKERTVQRFAFST